MIKNIRLLMKRTRKGRNDVVHEVGVYRKRQIELKELRKRIKDEFTNGINNLRAEDRYLIEERNKQHLLKQHVNTQKHWIQNLLAAKLRYDKKHDVALEKMSNRFCTRLNFEKEK